MKEPRRKFSEKSISIAYWFTLVSFIIPIVYLIVRIIINDKGVVAQRTDADYALMIVQCLLGVIVLHLPGVLSKRFRFTVPPTMYILYILFLYCAIFLGEVRNFYHLVPNWDIILHGFSSVMTGLFGFLVVEILNQSKKVSVTLSPLFIALFAFGFSISIGMLWEIYEFAFDGFLGLNMQKFLLEDGTPLVGRAALADTMEDIIVDTLGALIASLLGYFSLKLRRGWLHNYLSEEEK